MSHKRIATRSELSAHVPLRQALARPLGPHLTYARDEGSGAARPDAPVKLLVAEDDYLVATQIEDALREAGFEVEVVASAEKAIETAATAGVALVIMDVRLAGRADGVDAAIEIFKRYGIRSIFATAHTDRQIRQRAESAMPRGWLQKPYSMASLLATVRAALEAE